MASLLIIISLLRYFLITFSSYPRALLNFFIYVKSYHNILCCQGKLPFKGSIYLFLEEVCSYKESKERDVGSKTH